MEFKQIEQLFEKYQEATGGEEPIGLTVPTGFPYGSKRKRIESWGDVAEIYRECIAKSITWEELIGYIAPPDDVIL